ncbi:hypothetical protein [Chromobacterium violaceum]|uniref:hypothetical protein n=1 Tax=Chromobacterium violaceum TaxID=536 RepID=UPI00143D70F9|nr:hypothetical protein [Chromobacterium violaceum]QIY81520.1 hypothetical protein FOB43_21140 [Chromobacterium violaceum]
MEKCRHGLDIDQTCSKCVGESLQVMPAVGHQRMVELAKGVMTPANEHEHSDTLAEDVFYPDHPPRTESATFRATKKAGHAGRLPCAISGHVDGTEYHHLAIEWAYSGAVDWNVVRGVALGEITELPVLDLDTDQPTGATFAAKDSLLWALCKLAELRGFDWRAFDPSQPEMFVDSIQNMLVLHSKFHRHKNHGIHALTFPVWIFQAFPRVPGFVFAADELQQVHANKETSHDGPVEKAA